jgi:hypothetical protein
VASFDEKEWKRLTSWDRPPPTLTEMWDVLHSSKLPASFRSVIDTRVPASTTLRAALAQSLVASGRSNQDAHAALSAAIGHNVRDKTFAAYLAQSPAERATWSNNFANLVSGRFTELVFQAAYTVALNNVGVALEDATTDRSFVDYRLVARNRGEGFVLSINVKNAGRQMEKAQEFFGLSPEDTIPMATYKAFGSAQAGSPSLLYVYLVDWTLLERLRGAYWTRLCDAERKVFRLLTTFSGIPRNVEDDFIAATVEERLDDLLSTVGYLDLRSLPFRVISAVKCHTIFYEQHQRSPYVFVRRMNTDPNVHMSVAGDTIAFSDLVRDHLSTPKRRANLAAGLHRTKTMAIPDPPV